MNVHRECSAKCRHDTMRRRLAFSFLPLLVLAFVDTLHFVLLLTPLDENEGRHARNFMLLGSLGHLRVVDINVAEYSVCCVSISVICWPEGLAWRSPRSREQKHNGLVTADHFVVRLHVL